MSFMPEAKKIINALTYDALQVGKHLDPQSHKILTAGKGQGQQQRTGHCNNAIVTFGNVRFHGFACSYHRDRKDLYKKSMNKQAIVNLLNLPDGRTPLIRKRLEYALELICQLGLGVPTTCGYQIVIESDDITESDVYAYFLMGELGSAIRIKSDYWHIFHAYAFFHCTAVPIVKIGNRIYFKHPLVDIIGWGASTPS